MSVISVNNISKKYIIKHQSKQQENVKGAMSGFTKALFGSKNKVENEEFWALTDISFEVERGDRLGLIGSNGAGKSTLLKILSRITEPTSGNIRMKGRLASLLEVGTGFHQELTGRENIYLNGAILGMRRTEIDKHFDAIVDFAGIERFLDTPVKRYSSGMYVRLGFAIAAHLEPEILIVDEVLAVGDADFQKKSLGKMKDVSNSGRTLLFVSHNLTAVQGLCNKGAFLQHGKLKSFGEVGNVINEYVQSVSKFKLCQSWETPEIAPGTDDIRIKRIEIKPTVELKTSYIDVRIPLKIEIEFWSMFDDADLNISVFLYTMAGECIFNIGSSPKNMKKGIVRGEVDIPGGFLNDGSYYLSVMVVKDSANPLFFFEDAIAFDIQDFREGTAWYGKWPGAIRPLFIPVNTWQQELL
jgi:lipopolysaccharide transport system ATP-binding protein